VLAALLVTGPAGGCASHDSAQRDADDPSQARLASASDAVGREPSDTSDVYAAFELPVSYPELEAVVTPPVGWQPDPLKRTSRHAHQAWISPSGHTAYGVIRMNLPLPFLGADRVLKGFLDEMERTEGEAALLCRTTDRRLPGIRFVAEGGQYKLRANLVVRGFRAWAVYAGTRRDAQEVPGELDLAERARELTRIGASRARF
jgi:hypothetical protein